VVERAYTTSPLPIGAAPRRRLRPSHTFLRVGCSGNPLAHGRSPKPGRLAHAAPRWVRSNSAAVLTTAVQATRPAPRPHRTHSATTAQPPALDPDRVMRTCLICGIGVVKSRNLPVPSACLVFSGGPLGSVVRAADHVPTARRCGHSQPIDLAHREVARRDSPLTPRQTAARSHLVPTVLVTVVCSVVSSRSVFGPGPVPGRSAGSRTLVLVRPPRGLVKVLGRQQHDRLESHRAGQRCRQAHRGPRHVVREVDDPWPPLVDGVDALSCISP
jgi:hypothetical protein